MTVNVGSTQPTLGGVVDTISAPLVVNGGLGVNALNVDDSGSTANKSGTLTSSTITGLGMADGITYSDMPPSTSPWGPGGENFTIASTHTGSSQRAGGPGADVVTVQTTRGFTTVSGGAGNDTINVDAHRRYQRRSMPAPATPSSTSSPSAASRPSTPTAVTTINIQSISGPTTVNGDGRDVINVGSMAPQGRRRRFVYRARRWSSTAHGAWTSSTWTPPAPALPRTGMLTATTLTGLGMAYGITYGNLAALRSSTWAPAATISPSPAPPRGSTLINGGAGINAVRRPGRQRQYANVQGGTGSDAFTVGAARRHRRAGQDDQRFLNAPGGSTGTNSIAVTRRRRFHAQQQRACSSPTANHRP